MLDCISRGSRDSLGVFSSFTTAEDIAAYKSELARQRCDRALCQRRNGNQCGLEMTRPNTLSKPSCLEMENALAVLGTSDREVLLEFAGAVVAAAMRRPHDVVELTTRPQFMEALVQRYCEESDHEMMVLWITIICALFKTAGKRMCDVVDYGLTVPMFDMLESGDWVLVNACIKLMSCVAEACGYARNALICMGLHCRLVDMVRDGATPGEVRAGACNALLTMFKNPVPMENSVILEAVPELFQVMKAAPVDVVCVILQIFLAMTNRMSSLVMTLDDIGMYNVIVELLGQEALVADALALLGNMCVCQPKQARQLLELGVLDTLGRLIKDSRYTADALWVVSNLLESAPAAVLPLLSQEFTKLVTDVALTEGFGIEKEAAFFISTLIVCVHPDEVKTFMTPEVVDLLVEMLACEVELVVLRGMDAIRRFIHVANCSYGAGFLAVLLESDIMDRLAELQESSVPLISESAALVLNTLSHV